MGSHNLVTPPKYRKYVSMTISDQKKLRIGIIVDHPLRDLKGAVLLALQLSKDGNEVFLIPFNLMQIEVFTLCLDLVLLNNLRETTNKIAEFLEKKDGNYAILDTEGGLYGDLKHYTRTLTQRINSRNNLFVKFCWGEKISQYLADNKFFESHQLKVTGHPRFDFYSKKLDEYYTGHADKDGQKQILIPTKVAFANPQYHSLMEEKRLMVTKLGFDEAYVEEAIRVGKKQIEETIKMVKMLASDFPDESFVLRPHPHENLATYQNALTGLNNVKVTREAPIDECLRSAKCLIHRMCTTSIEASLAGVPTISTNWIETISNAPDSERVSFKAHTYDNLKMALDTQLHGGEILTASEYAAINSIVEDWFHAIDGNASRRISEYIRENLVTGGIKKQATSTDLYYIFRLYESSMSMKGIVGRIAYLMRNILSDRVLNNVLYPYKRRFLTSDKNFDEIKVTAIVTQLKNVEEFSEIKVLVETASLEHKYFYRNHSVKLTLIS